MVAKYLSLHCIRMYRHTIGHIQLCCMIYIIIYMDMYLYWPSCPRRAGCPSPIGTPQSPAVSAAPQWHGPQSARTGTAPQTEPQSAPERPPRLRHSLRTEWRWHSAVVRREEEQWIFQPLFSMSCSKDTTSAWALMHTIAQSLTESALQHIRVCLAFPYKAMI